MKALRWILLLLALGLLQTFTPEVWRPLGHVDWLLIAVVYMALRGSFREAVIFGAAAGLIQDGLSGDIVGLHGFAKTSMAAFIASFGSFLVVRGPLPEAVVTGIASLLESSIIVAWLVLLGRSYSVSGLSITGRALATAVATAAVFSFGRWLQQRRKRQSRFRK
jgi:rod shape-determining protein MreD